MNRSSPNPIRGLLIAQFFGAFNDNAWKLMVALLAIKQLASQMGSGLEYEAAAQAQTTITFVVFTFPLVVVSIFSGVFSDRFSKRSVIVIMKVVEVGLMGVGTVALFMNPEGGLLPLIVLGAMAVQSALFSPAKYGILPELLPHERLAAGNGQLELWTFLAIIGGTALGGMFLQVSGASPWLGGGVLLVFSIIGLRYSLSIPSVPRARAEGGLRETLQGAWDAVQADRVLRLGVMGNIGYWMVASLVGQDILVYSKAVLGLTDSWAGLPLATFGIGVGLGSVLAGKLSHSKVEVGHIPLGAIGLTVGLFVIGALRPDVVGTLIGMAWLGLSSGFIVVPINSLIQWRAPEDRRGAVIAFNNVFVFAGVLAGSLGTGFLAFLGLSASSIILAAGMATAGLTMWAVRIMPETFIRMVLFLVTHTLYRLHIIGRDHVPDRGGALLVPNHVSFVDGLLLLASVDRPIRFVVDRQYYEHPLFHRLAKIMGAIPISSKGSPKEILTALRDAGRRLDDGELVCIFPEGQITRTGSLLPFQQGFERILKGREAPVVPVHLDRVWGSIFSFIGGKFLTKWPEQIPYPVTISYGVPLPATVTSAEVRNAVQELGEQAWAYRKPNRPPLHHTFVRAVRRHPFRFAFADLTRPKVSCLESLVGAIALARAFRPLWEHQHNVGILLPPSVGGVLVNLAATLSGRTAVNLNYTAGKSGMEAAAKQAQLETIVTSQMFIEKAGLELPEGIKIIWIDEVRKTIGTGERITALLLAIFAPISMLERAAGVTIRPQIDDLATIIFSSGSTGEPKGVMLSHYNVDSNVEGVAQVFHLGPNDRLLGILPFFHSFGYLATIWLAVNHGVGVVYHPTPLDAGAIGELIHKQRVTILIATPTFLQLYLRRCTPDQFGSVRIILTGAEKLSERLAQAFEEKFGIRPIEGYGVTECAPVIAVNCPDFRAAGFYQSASRRGTVGRALPGVSVRIVDPDSFEPLPVGTAGMLLVKGPNVMHGYLGRRDLTAKAIHEGWYITGDIAILDEDGFITITDRLSRFAKIGGEMVPHGKVEEALHQAINAETQVLAVTSIPDEKKGEQLVVLHTLEESAIPEVLTKLSDTGLPNLFIPRKDAFLKVEKIPVLGTGKLDLRALKRIALERIS
ncbi:acyl-[ACP]--phospholipid O-acyltransferase [Candidatus Nitronereus thalassa]|uniref:Acyl-[ACP]--phospholipid O-acyltransferase n=1 Tax=Candidatus Nitronereus thalassa TaxID=3020898 RepID=A0ABU3KD15_9BACT|nr:acyl-[ACP]--phospholipid O-acyltransferase [Candidatus Nitronereus thalassa]MDT7044052.1 acyl-[ACP]--phospholipid O-acyltransferase [Candidatus Nitronereus thalassa]